MAVVNQLGSRSKEIRIGRSDRRQERQGKEEGRPCGICCDDDDVTLKNYISRLVCANGYVCLWLNVKTTRTRMCFCDCGGVNGGKQWLFVKWCGSVVTHS